jgi:hypothetical protein
MWIDPIVQEIRDAGALSSREDLDLSENNHLPKQMICYVYKLCQESKNKNGKEDYNY